MNNKDDWFKMTDAVLRDDRLNMTERVVLAYCRKFKTFFASPQHVAEELYLSVQCVRRSLKQLRKLGLIDEASSITNDAKDAASIITNDAKDAASSITNDAKDAASSITNDAKDAASSITNDASSITNDAIKNENAYENENLIDKLNSQAPERQLALSIKDKQALAADAAHVPEKRILEKAEPVAAPTLQASGKAEKSPDGFDTEIASAEVSKSQQASASIETSKPIISASAKDQAFDSSILKKVDEASQVSEATIPAFDSSSSEVTSSIQAGEAAMDDFDKMIDSLSEVDAVSEDDDSEASVTSGTAHASILLNLDKSQQAKLYDAGSEAPKTDMLSGDWHTPAFRPPEITRTNSTIPTDVVGKSREDIEQQFNSMFA